MLYSLFPRRCGGTGRRRRLKISRPSGHLGSTPSTGTSLRNNSEIGEKDNHTHHTDDHSNNAEPASFLIVRRRYDFEWLREVVPCGTAAGTRRMCRSEASDGLRRTMRAIARGLMRGAPASASLRSTMVRQAALGQHRHPGHHVRQLERARRQRRHPGVRRRLEKGVTQMDERSSLRADAAGGRSHRRRSTVHGRRDRRGPHSAARARVAGRHRANQPRARALAHLRAVDAQRQIGRRARRKIAAARFSQRYPSPNRSPSNYRASASGGWSSSRRPRQSPSRSFTSTHSAGQAACTCSGRRGCERSRPDRSRQCCRRAARDRRRSQHVARTRRAGRAISRARVSRDAARDRSRGLGIRVLDYMFFRAGAGRRAHYRQVRKPIRIGPSAAGGLG